MLFICHIFREAMIDRKVKTICSYLSLFLDKESHRNEQFPMLSSRRQRPLVQMNSWYIKQIGQEQHIQYLLSRQQHLQIYLGLVQLVGRGIELVIKSNSKYVKLSQCQLWLVELVDKLNIGYRFCRGSQKKKFENRKNYLFKICPSIH